jgi:hypothetical protein
MVKYRRGQPKHCPQAGVYRGFDYLRLWKRRGINNGYLYYGTGESLGGLCRCYGKKLRAEYQMVCWSGIGIISNYTEQDTPNEEWLMPVLYPYTDKACDLAIGNDPELWDFSRFVPDCIVINLGTNDNSYTKGIPTGLRYLR